MHDFAPSKPNPSETDSKYNGFQCPFCYQAAVPPAWDGSVLSGQLCSE